jgi:hypothetical protein
MKYNLFIFVFSIVVFFTACSKSGTSGGALSSGPSWTLTFDGKKYSWSGTLPPSANNSGVSAYISSTGLYPTATMSMASSLVSGSYPQNISIQLSSVNTGTFEMTPSTYQISSPVGNTLTLVLNGNSSTMYSTIAPGSNIIFKINSLSNKTLATNGYTGLGYVTGTFSGTIGDLSGGMHTISGSFNAARYQ